MKRVTVTWMDTNPVAYSRARLATNSTHVGAGLAGKNEPVNTDDVLLVQFYLHRVATMAATVGRLWAPYSVLRFNPQQLVDTSNGAFLRDKIATLQRLAGGMAKDGRVSVMPGISSEAMYADRSDKSGFRLFTMGELIFIWQMLTQDSKSSKTLSLQAECPARLLLALGGL